MKSIPHFKAPILPLRPRWFVPVSLAASIMALNWLIDRAIHPAQVFGNVVNLVVFNLQVNDKKTGGPITDLAAADFDVTDSGEPVRISYFRIDGLDPIAIWFIAGCSPSKDYRNRQTDSETSASIDRVMKELRAEDSVGVAQMCGSDAEITLTPTLNRDAAAAALDHALRFVANTRPHGTNLERLRKTLQLLHANLPVSGAAPVPAIVFLRPAEVSVTKRDAETLARDVLSHTTAVVYDVAPERRDSHPSSDAKISLLPYLSEATGGESISADIAAGESLRRVVAGLHSRYVLAWFPPTRDEWHDVTVRLAKEAAEKHGEITLACRSGYSVKPNPVRYSVTEKTEGSKADTPFSEIEAPEGADRSPIAFQANGATYQNTSEVANFTIKLDGDTLDWLVTPESPEESEVTVWLAYFSTEEKILGTEAHEFSVARNKGDDWMRLNQPLELSIVSHIPAGASFVRFRVRENVTGRTGTFDLPMKEVLEAPKHGLYGVIV